MRLMIDKARREEQKSIRTAEQIKADLAQKHFDGSTEDQADPTIFASSFEKRRFYLFSRREPDLGSTKDRDAIIGKDMTEEDIRKEEQQAPAKFMAKRVVLRTNMGDIELELWANVAPLAVENFSHLCKTGYYDNVIFHRVIKNFMIQTGDPTGTGYGGESMWGKPFMDEIVQGVEFDKPFLLAMANAGRATNKSQLFITTVPAAWLNGKHTIFGRVLKGMNVVKDIERARVNNDTYRPFDEMKIISTDAYLESSVCNKHSIYEEFLG